MHARASAIRKKRSARRRAGVECVSRSARGGGRNGVGGGGCFCCAGVKRSVCRVVVVEWLRICGVVVYMVIVLCIDRALHFSTMRPSHDFYRTDGHKPMAPNA